MKIRIVKKGIPKAQFGPPPASYLSSSYYLSQQEERKKALDAVMQNAGDYLGNDLTYQPKKLSYDFQSALNKLTGKFMPDNPYGFMLRTTPSFSHENAMHMAEEAEKKKKLEEIGKKDAQGSNPFAEGMGQASMGIKAFTGVANAVTDVLNNRKRQAEYNQRFRNNLLNPNPMFPTSESRGDYMVNEGVFRPDQMQTPNAGMYANPYFSTKMFRKYGGQMGYGLDLNQRKVYTDMPESMAESVSHTLSEQSNPDMPYEVETEGGETLYAEGRHFKIEGKRHSEGGVKLTREQAPEGSFIFSDTAKMRIGGDVLKEFGKSAKGGRKYTPAELAKEYMNNGYIARLNDPLSDKIQRNTANLMIANNENMLAKLALVQESKKGFRDGIPQMAVPYLESMMMGPNESSAQGMPQARYGGGIMRMMHVGGPADIDPYKGGRNKTPTGKSNVYSKGADHLQGWEALYPGISKLSNEEAQAIIYDRMLAENPDAVMAMWKEYGLTEKGKRNKDILSLSDKDKKGRGTGTFSNVTLTLDQLKKLKEAYVDGKFGARQFDAPKPPVVQQPPPEPEMKVTPPPPNKEDPFKPLDLPEFSPVNRKPVPYGMTTQDKLAVLASMVGAPKKYLPYISPLSTAQLTPTFRDWRGNAAALSGMANTMARTAASMSPTQGLASNLSYMTGQLADRLGQDISNTEQYNVDQANRFNVLTTDVRNKMNQFEAERNTELYKGNVIANQNKDNADRAYAQYVARPLIHGINQAQELYEANQMSPFFFRDPRTGRTVFKGPIGKPGDMSQFGFLPQMNTNSDDYATLGNTYSSLVSTYYNQLKQNKNLTEEERKKEAQKLAQTVITSRRTSSKNNPYGMSPSDYYRVSGYDFPSMPE